MTDSLYPAIFHLLLTRVELGGSIPEILLCKYGADSEEPDKWSTPTEYARKHESPDQTVIRSAQEKFGIIIEPAHLTLATVLMKETTIALHDYVWEMHLFFRVIQWREKPINLIKTIFSEIDWFPRDTLTENTIGYVRRAIHNYCQGTFYSKYSETESRGA